MKINYWKHIVVSFFVFLFLSIYITFPLILHLGDYVTGFGDELVIVWIQNWVIHALTTNPFSLFDANIYYPYNNSLAYSDIFLTSSIIAFLPLKITGEPISVINFTLISSLCMLGFFTFLLIYYFTKNFLLSILGGVLIIFSPATFDKIVHLQILSLQWIPLSLLFFVIFTKKYHTRYLILSLLFFVLQTYNSFLPGYFILFSYLIITIYIWLYKRQSFNLILIKKNILIVLLFCALLIPIILPYYHVSREFNYVRDIREAIHFALQPQDLFYPNQYTRLQNTLVKFFPTSGFFKTGYLGFVFSILTIITLINFFIKFKKKNIQFNSFTTIAIFGLIMSFGPFLHWNGKTIHEPFPIPLPYALLYYILPGFQGFRNPARWEMLFVLMMAVAVCIFLFKLLSRLSKVKRNLIIITMIILVIIEYNFPMHFIRAPQVKNFPKIYSWLQKTPKDSKIIEMPIYNWNMWPYTRNELVRQYYSTTYFRKMINGYSGFSPPPWQNMITEILSKFPKDNSLAMLKKMNINYIIVHKKEYDILYKDKFKINGIAIKDGNSVIQYLKKSLKFINKFDEDYIFSY